jgi:diguanylate cyclase (GGDEF)-like protein
MKEMHVLFVDDEIAVLSSLERYLITEPYQKHFISDPEKALSFMAANRVDVVVSDMRMPGIDGLTLLRKVRDAWPETIRIVLSGYSEIAQIIPCINTGEIFRYISKPVEPPELKAMLREALELSLMHRDKKELTRRLTQSYLKLKEANATLEHLSLTDSLTGIYNARHLYADLKQRNADARSAAPGSGTVSIVFLDISRFKSVVDTHGHINASKVLSDIGKTLQTTMEPPAYAATLGGDLFILVLPGQDQQTAAETAAAVEKRLSDAPPGKAFSDGVIVTFSRGIATWPGDADLPSGLLAVADRNLAEAKQRQEQRP